MKTAHLLQRLALTFCLWIGFTACEDTTFYSSVPSYPVEMRINIAGEYVHFVPENTGQTLIFDHQRFPNEAIGYAGLLLCTGYDMAYYAYDLACPKCLSREPHLEIDGMFAHCPICGEDYEIFNGIGNPQHGIVRENLRKYHTTYSSGTLHVYQ